MNQEELEEFAQFLRMTEMGNGGISTEKNKKQWLNSFNGKAFVSSSLFISAVVLFRTFGHVIA